MVYTIHIRIDRPGSYRISTTGALDIDVIPKVPFDDLSRRFKKYTHKPKYLKAYNSRDYILKIDDPNAWIYKYILYLNYPSKKIDSVDIYFKLNDKYNKEPLIFGFNQADDNSVYFTYWHLVKITHRWYGTPAQIYFLPSDGSFREDDLITRLLEELGLYVKDKHNKFVIRLGEKPNTNEFKYPKTGHNPNKITVSKFELTECPNFVKYIHTINSKSNVQSFYISFSNDSLYMGGKHNLKNLKTVDVYYNKSKQQTPVIIVFEFELEKRMYQYTEFLQDVKKSDPTKNISDLKKFQQDQLLKILIDEYDIINNTITFLVYRKEDGYSSRMHIKLDYGTHDKYKKYTHISAGPTGKYSNILLKNGPFKVEEKPYTEKVKEVTAYFLKYKTENEDEIPFLIEINPDRTGPNEHYYRSNDDEVNWIKLDSEVRLESILKDFNVVGHDFSQNRVKVYELLGSKSSKKEEESEDDSEEEDEGLGVEGPEERTSGLGVQDLTEVTHETTSLSPDQRPAGEEHKSPLEPHEEQPEGNRRQDGSLGVSIIAKVTDQETGSTSVFRTSETTISRTDSRRDTDGKPAETKTEATKPVASKPDVPGSNVSKPDDASPAPASPPLSAKLAPTGLPSPPASPQLEPGPLPPEHKGTEEHPDSEPSVTATVVVHSPGTSSEDHSQRTPISDRDPSRDRSPGKSPPPPRGPAPQPPLPEGHPETPKGKDPGSQEPSESTSSTFPSGRTRSRVSPGSRGPSGPQGPRREPGTRRKDSQKRGKKKKKQRKSDEDQGKKSEPLPEPLLPAPPPPVPHVDKSSPILKTIPFPKSSESLPSLHESSHFQTQIQLQTDSDQAPSDSTQTKPIGGSVGGVLTTAAVGGGATGVVYTVFPEWFIPAIKALV